MVEPIINVDVKSETIDHIVDTLSNGTSWIVKALKEHITTSPKSIAVRDYIESIRNSTSLEPQTKAVLIYNAKRDIQRWANTMAICNKAVEKLNSNAKPDDVNQDWVNLFENLSSNISSDDFQEIWATILARECNESGSVPKALLNVLAMMGQKEAQDFQNLASFCIKIGGVLHPVIIYEKIDDYYGELGLDLGALNRLETLRLINFDRNALGGMGIAIKNTASVEYFDEKTTVNEILKGCNFAKGEQGLYEKGTIGVSGVADGKTGREKTIYTDVEMIKLPIGSVTLSYIGEALMENIVPKKVVGFFEVATSFFKNPAQYIDSMFE